MVHAATWTVETTGTSADLNAVDAVVGAAGVKAWAVGDRGTVLTGTP